MSKFKVGDRVRIIETGAEYSVCAAYMSRSNLLGYGAIHNTKIELVKPPIAVYAVWNTEYDYLVSVFNDEASANYYLSMCDTSSHTIRPATLTLTSEK